MVKNSFSLKLSKAILEKDSRLCVGLDPRLDSLPKSIIDQSLKLYGPTHQAAASAILNFNRQIIEFVAEYAVAIKPQIAFYEIFGAAGIETFWQTVNLASQAGLVVIADAKRGDIDSTARAYAEAYLGGNALFGKPQTTQIDAITVSPFLGFDTLEPFVTAARDQSKGLFILVKTSNKGSGDIQNLRCDGQSVSERIAAQIRRQSFPTDQYGYQSLGAVVGATHPRFAKKLRSLLPTSIFLVPGFGAQGADPALLANFFGENGLGAIVNSSRGITACFAREDKNYLAKIAQSAKDSKQQINQASLKKS